MKTLFIIVFVSTFVRSFVNAYSNKNNWIPTVDTMTSDVVCSKLRSKGEAYESLSPDLYKDFVSKYASATEYPWNTINDMVRLDAARAGVVLVMGEKNETICDAVFKMLNMQHTRYIMCTFEVIDKEGLGEVLFARFIEKMTNVQYHLDLAAPVSYQFNMRRFLWKDGFIHRFVKLSKELQTLVLLYPNVSGERGNEDTYLSLFSNLLPRALNGLTHLTKLKTVVLVNCLNTNNLTQIKSILDPLNKIASIRHLAIIQPNGNDMIDLLDEPLAFCIERHPNLRTFLLPRYENTYVPKTISALEKCDSLDRLALNSCEGPLRSKVNHLIASCYGYDEWVHDTDITHDSYINSYLSVNQQYNKSEAEIKQFCEFMAKFDADAADINLNHLDLELCKQPFAMKNLTELKLAGDAGLKETTIFVDGVESKVYKNLHAELISQNHNLRKLSLNLGGMPTGGPCLEYHDQLLTAIESLQELKELTIDLAVRRHDMPLILSMFSRLEKIDYLKFENTLYVDTAEQWASILHPNLSSINIEHFKDKSNTFWVMLARCTKLKYLVISQMISDVELAGFLETKGFTSLEELVVTVTFSAKSFSENIVKSLHKFSNLKKLKLVFENSVDIPIDVTVGLIRLLRSSSFAFADKMELLVFDFGTPSPAYEKEIIDIPKIFRNLKKLYMVTNQHHEQIVAAVYSIPMLEFLGIWYKGKKPSERHQYVMHDNLARLDL